MKPLNDEELEKVSGGSGSNSFTCKICGCSKEGHHWIAGFKKVCPNGDIISRTVPICDECHETAKDDPTYFNWKERN